MKFPTLPRIWVLLAFVSAAEATDATFPDEYNIPISIQAQDVSLMPAIKVVQEAIAKANPELQPLKIAFSTDTVEALLSDVGKGLPDGGTRTTFQLSDIPASAAFHYILQGFDMTWALSGDTIIISKVTPQQ